MSNKMFMRVEEVVGVYHYCRKNRQKVLPRKILFHKNKHGKGYFVLHHLL